MDWCGADLSCWGLWLNTSAVRWAQVAVSLVIAWLALNGPKEEREHQRSNLIEEREYQEAKQREERLRLGKKEQLHRLDHAIGVLKVLRASAERLKKAGELLDQWIRGDERESAQLRRIRTDLEIGDRACSTIPLAGLSDHEMIDSVLEISRQTKLLILAIEDYLDTLRSATGSEIITVQILDRNTALHNLNTATLYLGLVEFEKIVDVAMDARMIKTAELRKQIHQ